MDKKYLLDALRRYLEYYRDSINEMKTDPKKVGPYGVKTPFFPLYNRKGIFWILDSLGKIGCNTSQFEREVSKIDEEFKAYEKDYKEDFLNPLYNDLKGLIGTYEEYFSDFQKYKDIFRANEELDPLYKEYFLNRNKGLFFADEYEFDILISVRTYIEILFEYLDGKLNIEGLKNKVQEMDNIFKKDLDDILKCMGLDEYPSYEPFAPAKYWWLHIN
ncbi:hypothetical protein EO98_16230 [Methanosarcina sp. 2.H.T.1A.6]|uniref:hypothetical protein n=1 Tax=unclassified Methanosarcina TaxID=2644672 RepID=UPI000622153C|nr:MULTISPECIES: hypothetical protein [unclassified Methanosarcina]KKG09875.1 hypothetical protein EO97_08990 [Methanosarcina sp. 2.H.T.1A.15]KKG17697.1 hypothetical protein EO94_12655 [Methanosarcina sp. 2.H.T.1A.3]KKG21445.1 hypothetical protein EO96_07965 [Methanosarcina sp. 2.H.T.1A.8]KKG21937.1 hypothetical protein EO98_16230 [Methanosarcina sp. 2.H.T.1A.6]